MKTILFIFLFVTSFSFSQNKKFTIKEIDSICNSNGSNGVDSSNYDIINNRKEIIGKGSYVLKTYILPKDTITQYESLNIETIAKYIEDKKLIKGTYYTNAVYNNLDTVQIDVVFYYYDKNLFFAKIKIIKKENNKESITENFEFLIDKKIKIKKVTNILNFNLEDYIKNCNNQILNFNE